MICDGCDGLNQNFLKSLDFCFDPTQATPPKGGRHVFLMRACCNSAPRSTDHHGAFYEIPHQCVTAHS